MRIVLQELNKQGEDPNNPWVWLTSYSRIPASDNYCVFRRTCLFLLFSWKLFKISARPPRTTALPARRERRGPGGCPESRASGGRVAPSDLLGTRGPGATGGPQALLGLRKVKDQVLT